MLQIIKIYLKNIALSIFCNTRLRLDTENPTFHCKTESKIFQYLEIVYRPLKYKAHFSLLCDWQIRQSILRVVAPDNRIEFRVANEVNDFLVARKKLFCVAIT